MCPSLVEIPSALGAAETCDSAHRLFLFPSCRAVMLRELPPRPCQGWGRRTPLCSLVSSAGPRTRRVRSRAAATQALHQVARVDPSGLVPAHPHQSLENLAGLLGVPASLLANAPEDVVEQLRQPFVHIEKAGNGMMIVPVRPANAAPRKLSRSRSYPVCLLPARCCCKVSASLIPGVALQMIHKPRIGNGAQASVRGPRWLCQVSSEPRAVQTDRGAGAADPVGLLPQNATIPRAQGVPGRRECRAWLPRPTKSCRGIYVGADLRVACRCRPAVLLPTAASRCLPPAATPT